MLFRQEFLDGIRAGTISLAFRRWRRPTVRPGGTLLTAVGQLRIGAISRVSEADISSEEARRAGFASREDLLAELNRRPSGDIHRIEIAGLRPDPRIDLRETVPDVDDRGEILLRLDRLDKRGTNGAWTRRTLDIIAAHPGVRAGDLCGFVGMEKEAFKLNVRKLKNLGLTESLGTGYKLTPRGEAIRAIPGAGE